jgi:transposase-like protein
MPRPPRSPHTAETRQRALAALYASGDDVDGEWVPNATAVSRVVGMPTTATLLKWWRDRDKTQDSTHLKAAQRAREEARQQGADAFFTITLGRLREGVSWVLDPEHRQKEPRYDASGRMLTAPDGSAVLGYVNRPDHMSRAYKDAAQTIEKIKTLLAPTEQVEEDLPPEEAAAQTVALLQRNPELLARAFSSLSPEARAAILEAADREE